MIRVTVFPEETDVFLSKALCPVMFFLAGDVSNCVSYLRNANALTPALRDGDPCLCWNTGNRR
jgi:hypothetical protein